nr:EAL domain-containing protein [Paracoccaceae bacterium]
PSYVSIESWLDTISHHKNVHPPGESWERVSARLPNTTLTLHYHRNIDDLTNSKLSAVYQTIGSLVGGLAVAFGALCLLGSRLMLNPYKALQASRESLKESNEALQYSAFHDALTGLANRRGLEAHLDKLEMERRQNGGGLAVMHLDLDRFKQINDTLGHAAGDHVLTEVAKLLRENVGPEDFVARIGGDEFVIVAPSVSNVEALKTRAQGIIEATRRPVPYEEHQCRFGASIGVACGEGRRLDAKKLLVNADIALYRAKRQGRNAAVLFSQEDEAEVRLRKTLTDELRSALDHGEFFAVYQPQVDAKTLEIVGVEALARWRHPTRGVLAPAAFLQVAEDLGVVSEIDERILDCAMRDSAVFKEAGFKRPKVSVNVSLRRLRDDQLLQKVKKLNFERGALVFELLESIFLDDTDAVLQHNIDTLREMGVEIEIDDFGTGHASMMSLVRLGPDKLKIDRQFIQPLIDSPVSQRLVASMLEIAEALEIGVVAEGVETLEHVELLRDMGCEVLQGYALAKPMPTDQLVHWLRDGGATRLLSTEALSACDHLFPVS